MSDVISLIVSMSACLLGGILRKYFTFRFGGRAALRHLYNAVGSLVSAVILFFWGGFGSASVFTLLLGTVFGIVTALQQITTMKAMECGPWSYTSVITSLSTLIPALSGALIWHEELGVLQIVGMAFMVVCLILSVDTSADTDCRKAPLQWLLYCAVAFACAGGIGVMQKWHQTSDFRGELNAFLVIAFFISTVYSVVMIFLSKKEPVEETDAAPAGADAAKTSHRSPRTVALLLLVMVVSGACVAANNKLNLYLSGVMDSAVFFPLVNGGNLILTALSALFLFRERLTGRQWIGIGAGLVAVLLLCLG